MSNARTTTIEHNGRTLFGKPALITHTRLGVNDHGIVTAGLCMKGDGWGTWAGGDYCLDAPAFDESGTFTCREGTAFGLDYIMRLLEVVGKDAWEKCVGERVFVLYETNSALGKPAVGLAHMIDEKRVLIFADHIESWKDRM